MLAKQHRVLSGNDFKATVRRGKRFASPHAVVYAVRGEQTEPPRFGFIVSKAVGNAVVRNRLRRRLRSIAAESLRDRTSGPTVVVRILPETAALSWDALRSEISVTLQKAVSGR